MKMSLNENHILIDIPFSASIITSRTSAIILRTVIEFLSYFRKQIPFPYDTFKFMTAKIQRQISNEVSDGDLSHMQIDRQQRLAIDTFHSVKILLENLTEQLEKTECLQALIMFGATLLTPKEAFLINIPSVTKYHHAANHQEATQNIAKNITMSILTSQKLYEIESKLNATNMFVLLRPKIKLDANDLFQLNEDFQLPRNCKTVILNLKNVTNPIPTNCCQQLVVFDDVIDNYDQMKMSDDNNVDSRNGKMDKKDDDEFNMLNEAIWYESTVFVRGFKDLLVKGKSVWNI